MVSVATIAMIILIIIVMLLNSPDQRNTGDLVKQQTGKNNIFLLLKETYSKYESGVFDRNIIYGEKDSLINFLSDPEIGDSAFIDRFSDWNLSGVFLHQINNVLLPHFIYRDKEKETIFAVQFPFNSKPGKQDFSLSNDLINYLAEGNCFSSRQDGKIYLLKMYMHHIGGFITEKPKKAIIWEICSQND